MQRIFIPELAAGDGFVRDKSFGQVVISGPAILMPLDDCRIERCAFGADIANLDAIFWPLHGRTAVTGAIGLERVEFVECQFELIGWSGTDDFIAKMKQDLFGPGPGPDD